MKNFLKLSLLLSTVLVSCSKVDEKLNTYQVNISTTEGGTIEGIPNANEVLEGKVITLTANPIEGEYKDYIFEGWSGNINSTENPLSLVVTGNISITAIFRLKRVMEDEIYSQIVHNDFESYIKAFIKDAERHGVILDSIDIKGAILDLREEGEPFWFGAATDVCNPKSVNVIWNPNDWDNPKLFTDDNIRKLTFFWHEFGHTILGLRHTCTNGHIMTSSVGANCQGPVVQTEGVGEINITHMSFNSKEPVRNFQRAVDDMFSLKDQYHYECRTSFTSKDQSYSKLISCSNNPSFY